MATPTTATNLDLLEHATLLTDSVSCQHLRDRLKQQLTQRKYHVGILACRQGILESAGRATMEAGLDITRLQQLRDAFEKLLVMRPPYTANRQN